jgi:hypothetical protein
LVDTKTQNKERSEAGLETVSAGSRLTVAVVIALLPGDLQISRSTIQLSRASSEGLLYYRAYVIKGEYI